MNQISSHPLDVPFAVACFVLAALTYPALYVWNYFHPDSDRDRGRGRGNKAAERGGDRR